MLKIIETTLKYLFIIIQFITVLLVFIFYDDFDFETHHIYLFYLFLLNLVILVIYLKIKKKILLAITIVMVLLFLVFLYYNFNNVYKILREKSFLIKCYEFYKEGIMNELRYIHSLYQEFKEYIKKNK